MTAANQASTSAASDLPQWGRVLIAGGTDWPNLGRKASKSGPHRPSTRNTTCAMSRVHTSPLVLPRPSSSRSTATPTSSGRNEQGQCGLSTKNLPNQPSGPAIWDTVKLGRATHFAPPLPADQKGDIVYAATGRSHTILVTAADPVVAASCGVTFSMLLTASGKVYAMGSSEKGQLGNGRTGEHFISGTKLAFDTFDEPFLILELHCGQQHTIARDDNGYVYTWGFGGYGRLGLGTQQDQLAPTLVPQFARENTLTRATPHLRRAHQQRRPDGVRGDHDATMNVCWGQNAHHGELGLGEGKPRSAVKPMRCETLDGLSILDIGAGQSTTYYIARNLGPTYAELARFPEVVPSSDACVVCNSDASSDENALLECEKNGTKRSAPAADEPAAATGDGQQEGDDETAAATAGMTRKGSRSAPKRRRA
ncbi:related to SRM1 |uniref:Related to SRM1 \|nr:related to SRM1 \